MATSFTREITVTITPKAGDAITLTGAQGASFWAAFERGESRIMVLDPENGARTIYTEDCICSASWENVRGEDYVKPDADPLFCPDKVTSLSIDAPTSVQMGTTDKVTVTPQPATAVDIADVMADLAFISSDDAVLTVSADGTITPVAEGKARITATAGSFTVDTPNITVTVAQNAEG